MLPTPAQQRHAAVRANGAQLQRWLNVLAWLTLAYGLLIVLGLIALVVWLLSSGGAAFLSSLNKDDLGLGTSGLGTTELTVLVLLTVLLLLPTLFTFLLLRWARELLGQFGRWALGQPVDLPRAEVLRRTLGNWIVVSQWAPVVLLGLSLLTGIVALALVPSEDRLAGLLGSDLALFFSVLLYAPFLVINWLILGSVRRWMDSVGLRLRGSAGPPVTPVAGTVGVWFIVCMVLVGLNAVSVLPAVFVFSLLPLIPDSGPAGQGAPPAWFGPLMAGLLSPSLLLMALHFALLLWSRGFALAVAQEADARMPAPPAPSAQV